MNSKRRQRTGLFHDPEAEAALIPIDSTLTNGDLTFAVPCRSK
jgi:hypothetical protein